MILHLVVSALRDLWRRPWPVIATVAAVAVTVFFGGLFALASLTLDGAFAHSKGRVQFQVYWKPGAAQELVNRQLEWMRALPGLVDSRAFTPAQALAVMGQSFGKDADLSFLGGQNPLPYTALLSFRLPVGDEGFARDMYDRLVGVEGVAEVRYNPVQVDMAQSLGVVGRRIVVPLAAMLSLLVGLVVGNTIRLSLLRRREEMEILRLVGATEWYIRWPMVIGAAVVGVLGGVLAMVLLKLVQVSLAEALDVPPLWLSLPFLPAGLVMACILGTGLVSALAGLAAAMESRP
jgi:cell division transport system permease protein